MQATPTHHNTLVNFCSDLYVSEVCCESVTADGHSSSNLVADADHLRSRGLRVEHYIRPPVTLTLELCVPVNVLCILVCPDLPQQAEMRLELSGSSLRTTGAGGGNTQYRLCQDPLLGRSGSLLVARNRESFTNIQQCNMASLPDLSSLVVHRSYAHKDLKKFVHTESPLKHVRILRHLRCLQLRVTKWTGPKPVCIKWLEIWGVLSRSCSKEEMRLFQSKINTTTHFSEPSQPPNLFREDYTIEQTLSSHKEKKTEARNLSASTNMPRREDLHGGVIPEQFLDELTCELMVLPMVLPSGHCVDQSTLDRLAHNDSTYGRPPTDPFTGLPFTELCKPEFCAGLKASLDSYLCRAPPGVVAHDITSAGGATGPLASAHTLGDASDIQQHLLRTGKSSGSYENALLPPPSKKTKKLENPCKGIESEHPVSANTPTRAELSSGLIPAPSSLDPDHNSAAGNSISSHGPDHNSVARNRRPVTSSFDLEVGKSLQLALDQLLHKNV